MTFYYKTLKKRKFPPLNVLHGVYTSKVDYLSFLPLFHLLRVKNPEVPTEVNLIFPFGLGSSFF